MRRPINGFIAQFEFFSKLWYFAKWNVKLGPWLQIADPENCYNSILIKLEIFVNNATKLSSGEMPDTIKCGTQEFYKTFKNDRISKIVIRSRVKRLLFAAQTELQTFQQSKSYKYNKNFLFIFSFLFFCFCFDFSF